MRNVTLDDVSASMCVTAEYREIPHDFQALTFPAKDLQCRHSIIAKENKHPSRPLEQEGAAKSFPKIVHARWKRHAERKGRVRVLGRGRKLTEEKSNQPRIVLRKISRDARSSSARIEETPFAGGRNRGGCCCSSMAASAPAIAVSPSYSRQRV